MFKKVIFIIVILFVSIQFIPNELPEVIIENENDFLANNSLPDKIEQQIRTSCYDCHSNETVYPWYSYVAPVSFLVKRDVEVGRKELNFSNWESLSKSKKAKKISDIIESVEEGEMPFPVYLITHSDAKLDKESKEALLLWADTYAEKLFE
ncbi:MAG: heme-binding domain-containing protein [Bacteroidota bacterium]